MILNICEAIQLPREGVYLKVGFWGRQGRVCIILLRIRLIISTVVVMGCKKK